MEVMLGMRQAVEPVAQNAFPAEAFPFNALEVQVLKSLARTATNGASEEAEPYVPEVVQEQAPAPRKTLKPITVAPSRAPAPKSVAKAVKKPLPSKPAAPIKRQPKQVDEVTQRILQEEGVTMEELNAVFPPDYQPLDPNFDHLSDEEKLRRNAEAKKRLQRRVPSPQAAPMPSQDQINAMYTARADAAAAHPQMQTIMQMVLSNPKKQ
jgi:hypothetical protein